jgi:hypothetical protein
MDQGAMTMTEEQVERFFERVSHHDLPVWVGVTRVVAPETLEDARDIAFERADEAGRRSLLDVSLERVDLAYARHLGAAGYWTGVFAVPVPASAADRAGSQGIVEDLVTALVVEDLVPEDVAGPLRADGERLLRIGDDEGDLVVGDDGGPPVEPFRGPLVTATIAGGIVLAAVWSLFVGFEGLAAVVAGMVVLLARHLRR